MRTSNLISILAFLLSSTSTTSASTLSPFIPTFPSDLDFITSSNTSDQVETSNNRDILLQELKKRDGNCPKNYNSCSTLAAADRGSCCTKNAVCSLDFASQVACCPTGAFCTGTIAVASTTVDTVTTTTSGFVLGGGGAGTTSIVSSTSSTSTTTTTTSPKTTATTTFLTNSFFNFPRIASTYSNSLACLSAFTACQTNYAQCTADLQGGSFGVTISAANGGTTVVPSTGTLNLGLASATSICSSLSSVACLDIKSSQCAQFGSATGSATTTVGFVTGTNAGIGRGCGCECVGFMAVAAAGVGIAGGLV